MPSTIWRCSTLLMLSLGVFAAEPADFIVVCKPGTDVGALTAELAKQRGVSAEHQYKRALHGFSARLQQKDVDALRADPRIQRIEPDIILSLPPTQIERIVPNGKPGGDGKPSKPGGGGGSTPPPPPQEIPNGIMRINAINGVAPAGVAVAVVDTGIPKSHPDLNVVGGATFVRGSKSWNDDNGHGGHVAGTIGARDNDEGVIGVAPGIPLYAVKVLNSQGSGSLSGIIAGIDWCISANADSNANIRVLNMSLGGSGYNASFEDAVNRAYAAGIIVVVDAGTSQPASFANVIAVSAIADSDGIPGAAGGSTNYGADDTLASFSNYGSVVDIAAPGVSILSTYLTSYASLSGTSMASPHVAGVCALAVNTVPPTGTPNGEWVQSVKVYLIENAIPQAHASGFTGDKDAFAEPLVDATPVSNLEGPG